MLLLCLCVRARTLCLSVFFVLIDNYLGKMKGKKSVNRTHPKAKKIIVLSCTNLKELREQKKFC